MRYRYEIALGAAWLSFIYFVHWASRQPVRENMAILNTSGDPRFIIGPNKDGTDRNGTKIETNRFTYYVAIPRIGFVFKTRPESNFAHGTPNRIDGITGIGATVWFETEWGAITNALGTNASAWPVIDLTKDQL